MSKNEKQLVMLVSEELLQDRTRFADIRQRMEDKIGEVIL